MQAEKYRRNYGKLNKMLALPLDDKMKDLEVRAKRAHVAFNEWLRDLIYANSTDLEEIIKSAESNQSPGDVA